MIMESNSVLVYSRDQAIRNKQGKFKPGSTPYCPLGNETLNGQVNWLETLTVVLASKKFTLISLSQYLDVKKEILDKVLENDLSYLNFKTGAKLLALHDAVEYCTSSHGALSSSRAITTSS